VRARVCACARARVRACVRVYTPKPLIEHSIALRQHRDAGIPGNVVDMRRRAEPDVRRSLWTYLFFSPESFDQALLVNLALSVKARGGISVFLPVSLPYSQMKLTDVE